ncbi:MAG: superoxide dismutase [Fe] [Legionellales bacterium]|nr:superoxide dismutase [Fe] [Legionellales bacterium]
MEHTLPALPYALDALEPHISKETLEYHYGKHHKTYVDNLNKLIENTQFSEKSLEDIILSSDGGIFNNAAQIWNHTFYFNCLSPEQTNPSEELKQALEDKYSSMDEFKQKFTQTAITTFGSGWAWLVQNENKELDIISTSNAKTPLTQNYNVLLTCDVWEHAYYIDHRNARPKYLETFWKIVNWDFVSGNFSK